MTKKKNKDTQEIIIEREKDLRQELIHVHDIDKDLIAMTNFLQKKRHKLLNMVGLLRTGTYDIEDALTEVQLSKPSYYRMRRAATEIEAKLEELGIDYEDTEFFDLIDTMNTVDRSMASIQKKVKEKILERFDGKFNRTTVKKIADDGKEYEQEMVVYDKPASATELIKVAEFFDKKKRPDAINTNISIENNNAMKQEKTVFEIIDPEYVLNNLSNSTYDRTIAEIENIERQIANGDFDE